MELTDQSKKIHDAEFPATWSTGVLCARRETSTVTNVNLPQGDKIAAKCSSHWRHAGLMLALGPCSEHTDVGVTLRLNRTVKTTRL